ncbi:hypothetical protein XBFM1_1260021 [Xenorhabdus bovienii str. feltiae Moldova]|uniref:Nucleotidyltransferase n=1 Tax=Xenorhabdus bovienii str. feltiae Moldova TaxID=1398200 RepID=A0A077NCH5_XENBV|nr:hypothetical protein XBFM1_1260021 [Xenorhabdus bovienii str. feltiae Moldova]
MEKKTTAVSPAMHTRVKQELAGIEKRYGVRILYACESGSRGWGFASPDSDYDVRFIYVHPVDEILLVWSEFRWSTECNTTLSGIKQTILCSLTDHSLRICRYGGRYPLGPEIDRNIVRSKR